MTTASGETTTTAGTRAFVDAMLAHNTQVRAEIERAAAGLAGAGVTGPVLDGLGEVAGHYDGARGRWEALGAALKQHEALAEQARATAGAATDLAFYTDDTSKEAMTASADTTGPARRGHHNPDQPRAADGKWIKVGDVLGYADDETCFGTDRVTGRGPVPTDLALVQYPDGPGVQAGAFVSVATPRDGFDPVTNKENDGRIYCAPQLDAAEAEVAADRLDELAGLIDDGFRPPEPTKHTRARQRIELLLAEKKAGGCDRITVGEDESFPLSTNELLKLLREADPTLSAPQTRHAIRAHAAGAAGGEDGTVWLDMEPDAAGGMHVVVTAVEGTEDPDDDYYRDYAAKHTPDSARELAGKLRAFARAARRRGTGG